MNNCTTIRKDVSADMDRVESAMPDGRIFKLLRITVLVLILILTKQTGAIAQIDFGSFGNYTIQLTEISMGDLEFDGPVGSGGGVYEVTLANSFIFAIEGVKYLDVGVLIIADGELLLEGDLEHSEDPQKSIPFTLEAAYANKGQENISDAEVITIIANMGDARFPILSRQFLPPGPPPPPPTDEFDQSQVEGSAFLYLYGTIDVGNVEAGTYFGTINISVQYDNPPTPPSE